MDDPTPAPTDSPSQIVVTVGPTTLLIPGGTPIVLVPVQTFTVPLNDALDGGNAGSS